LNALLADLRFIRDSYILEPENMDRKEVLKCIGVLLNECDRLYLHRELLPFEPNRGKFFGAIYVHYHQIDTAIKLWGDWHNHSKDVYEKSQQRIQTRRHASMDPTRTPWNNFVQYGSTGVVPYLHNTPEPRPSLRTIPPAGMQILLKWQRSHAKAENIVAEVRHPI
jgi:hypothetical protein